MSIEKLQTESEEDIQKVAVQDQERKHHKTHTNSLTLKKQDVNEKRSYARSFLFLLLP